MRLRGWPAIRLLQTSGQREKEPENAERCFGKFSGLLGIELETTNE
jgi:hypothetical protein